MREVAQIFEVPLIEDEYTPEEWNKIIQGRESDSERSKRCRLCIQYRLERTLKRAVSDNFNAITTSLSISPHKKFTVLMDIAKQITQDENIIFLLQDFKKKDGFKKSVEFCKEEGLYRQDYCGCKYSMRKN